MANITVPIQVNVPDDWVDQIIDRLRNDPDADWVDVTRCKDCKHYIRSNATNLTVCNKYDGLPFTVEGTDFCSRAERRTDEPD